ncbi:MAG: hypothetical protein IPG68_01205 [Micrococcales bacterium]|nr:hypothetical protein [Micrococcales bacterium]
MSSPRSVRFETSTLNKLSAYASRHPGMTSSGAAALLVEEGLRMDEHPGIVFRDGPAGRRAGLAGGPDVWEVITAVISAREADLHLGADNGLALVADNAGLPVPAVQIAVRYYGDYPDEIDQQVRDARDAQATAERALRRTSGLLGR